MYHIDRDDASYHTLDLAGLTLLAWRTWTGFPDEEDLRPFLTFRGRADYLAWVDAWKRVYRTLSDDIRGMKAELARPHAELDDASLLMSHREQARALARVLLALRHAGKRESQRQKQRAAVEGEEGEPEIVLGSEPTDRSTARQVLGW